MANEGANTAITPDLPLRRKRQTLERPQMRAKVRAMLLDGMTDADVARAISNTRYPVTHQAVRAFRKRHRAELAQAVAEVERRIEDAAISHVVNRVWDAQTDYDRLGAVIDARAQDTRYSEPGYATGLMAHQLKQLGGGENTQIVDEFKVDTALVAERRAIRREVAEVRDQLPRGTGDGAVAERIILIRERIIERESRMEPLG